MASEDSLNMSLEEIIAARKQVKKSEATAKKLEQKKR